MSTLELVVAATDDTVPGIRTLTLRRSDGAVLPSFTPGSHIVIDCDGTANAYSLTGESVAPVTYVVSVLEVSDGAGGSRWIHRLVAGDPVSVRAPRSAFAPVLRARRHLLVAAGIGITPMVSHLRSARRWNRDIQLLYVYKDGRGAHVDDVKELTDQAQFFTDREFFGAELTEALSGQPFGTHLYICGPAPFMTAVTDAATRLGWPSSRIHLERFGIGALDPGVPFEVTLPATDERFTVPAGVSLLEALEQRGHRIPNLCRQGVCGECRLTVLSGNIVHRDLFLTDADKAAADCVMSCVSRAGGPGIHIALPPEVTQ